MAQEKGGLRLVSHEQYLAETTWQRLIGNAVGDALSGNWASALTSSRYAMTSSLPRAVLGRVRPAQQRRQQALRQQRERQAVLDRLARLELWQKVPAVAPELLDRLRQGSDYSRLVQQIADLLGVSEDEADDVLSMPLRQLTPQGIHMAATEIEGKRRRLEEEAFE